MLFPLYFRLLALTPAGTEGLGANVNLGAPVNREGEHRMGVSRRGGAGAERIRLCAFTLTCAALSFSADDDHGDDV